MPTTSFHGDNAAPLLAKERQPLIPSQLLAKDHAAQGISPISPEHVLREIAADSNNLRHDRLPKWSVARHCHAFEKAHKHVTEFDFGHGERPDLPAWLRTRSIEPRRSAK